MGSSEDYHGSYEICQVLYRVINKLMFLPMLDQSMLFDQYFISIELIYGLLIHEVVHWLENVMHRDLAFLQK